MIVNFTLEKIASEKKGNIKGNVEANNSVKFLDVKEGTSPQGLKDQVLLDFKFEYKIKYLPDVATTEMVGHIFYLVDKKDKDQILTFWTKDEKVDPKLATLFVNQILSRCGVKALSLSQELGLPAHVPLPRIGIKKQAEKEEKGKAKAS